MASQPRVQSAAPQSSHLGKNAILSGEMSTATTTGWKAFADTVAGVLALNLWLTMVLIPGLYVGLWNDRMGVFAALVPFAPLAIGLWRRSELILLFAYPVSLLTPIVAHPAMVSDQTYGPIRFVIVALSFIAYLLCASVFTSFYEPPRPHSIRPLSSASGPVSRRWARRRRMYTYLAVLSFVTPALLLVSANYLLDADTLENSFPGRTRQMTAFVNVVVLIGWFIIYHRVFLDIFKKHRVGDKELGAQIAARRPRWPFYAGFVTALLLMLYLVL